MMRKQVFIQAFILVALLASASMATAAELKASTLKPAVGVPFRIEVKIDEQGVDAPAIRVPGLDVRYIGPQTQMRIENGRYSANVTHAYQGIARKAGKITIPRIELQVTGQREFTNALTLNVVKEKAPRTDQARAWVDVQLARENPYVGEFLPVEVKLYIDSRIRVRQVSEYVRLEGEGFTSENTEKYEQAQEIVEGNDYNVFIYRSAISAVTPGSITIDPTVVEALILQSRQRSSNSGNSMDDIFDSFFGRSPGARTSQKQISLQSEPLEITVLPLPKDGRPANFGGAVGQFSMEVAAAPAKVKAGDPISITAKLRGQGNFNRISGVTLEHSEDWQAYPAKAEFLQGDSIGSTGEKKFEQMLIPENGGVASPSISFSYFDPEAKKYVVLEEKDLQIEVTGSRVATQIPPVVAKGPGDDTDQEEVAAADILHIDLRENLAWKKGNRRFWKSRFFWSGNALLAILTMGWIVMKKKRSTPEAIAKSQEKFVNDQRDQLKRRLTNSGLSTDEFLDTAQKLLVLDSEESATEVLDSIPPEKPYRQPLATLIELSNRHRWAPGVEVQAFDDPANRKQIGEALDLFDHDRFAS